MSRVRRGFKLAGVSWQVVVAEPAMLLVLAAGFVTMAVVSGALLLLLFQGLPSSSQLEFPGYLVVAPVLWIGSVITTYCSVVVTVMADRRLRGQDPTVADGMSVATAKLNRILTWTFFALVVGLVLQAIAERFRVAGAITSRLLGVAWRLATMFVIPVLALEDLTVTDSVKRSASIFKSKWGESVVAQGTVGLAVMLAMLPAMFVVLLVLSVSTPAGIGLGVLVFGAVALISAALDAVVDVALYRYAMDGEVLGAFSADDLDGLFKPKND